jgi:hypothetical protein
VSDPSNPAAPAAQVRPRSVTISSYLLFLVAGLLVIVAIISLSTLGTVADVYRDAYQGTEAKGLESIVVGAGAAGTIVQLLLAAGFVILGLLNNRGRNVSRIVTWVVGGIGVCCTGLGLAGTGLANQMNAQPTTGNLPDPGEVQRRLEDALPSWYQPVSTTLTVLALLALLGALILLALPASNEFFRKPQPAWEPPVPGYPGPTYPGSTYPGYPATPPLSNPPGPPSNPPGPPSNPPPAAEG